MKAALKKGVEAGTLVMLKNSYKVSAEAKKPIKVKKPVAAKVKKTVVKKVKYMFIICLLPIR
jgi:histone H1/5